MREEVFKSTVAGLLHDIGKIDGIKGHAERSSSVAINMGLDREVHEVIVNHHYKEKGVAAIPNELKKGVTKHIFLSLKAGDWLASAFRPEEKEMDTASMNTNGIISPFSSNLEWGVKWISTPYKSDGIAQNLHLSTKNYQTFILTLLRRIYAFAFRYTDYTRNPIVSLASHLHLVGAISGALMENIHFRNAVNNIGTDIVNEAFEELSKSNAKVFTVAKVDIKSIQDFLTDIMEKDFMKNVAGRSFFINVLGKTIPLYIAKRYGVSAANILTSSGGTSLLLLPYKEDVDISQIRDEIVLSLLEQDLELPVSVTRIDLTLRDVFEYIAGEKEDLHPLSRAINSLTDREDFEYLYIMNEHMEKKEKMKVNEEYRCDRCGKYRNYNVKEIENEGRICNVCERMLSISEIVLRYKGNKEGSGIEFKLADEILRIENDKVILNEVEMSIGNRVEDYISKPSLYERDEDGSIKPLDRFGAYYSVMKLDGDSVGELVRNILEQHPVRFMMFSYAMEMFFERKLVEKLSGRLKRGAGGFHIIYAGGDDVLAAGELNKLIELYDLISGMFEYYKTTGEIEERSIQITELSGFYPTLSGGLGIYKKKYKFRWAYEYTTKLLETAKDIRRTLYKDERIGVLVIQEPFLYFRAREVLNASKTSEELLTKEGDKGGRTPLYRIYRYMEELTELVNTYKDAIRNRRFINLYSSFKHYVGRWKEDDEKKKIREISDEFLKSILNSLTKREKVSENSMKIVGLALIKEVVSKEVRE